MPPPKQCISAVLSLCCLTSFVIAEGPYSRHNLPGRPYDDKDDEDRKGWMGFRREFDVFDTRDVVRGGRESKPVPPDLPFGVRADWGEEEMSPSRSKKRRKLKSGSSSIRSSDSTRNSYRSTSPRKPGVFQSAQDWWYSEKRPTIRIKCEPTTTIKLRKTFYPLKTIVRLGAEFNTQLGVWQFKSSWQDDIIGGKLTLKGRELQLKKSWQLSVGGPMEDLVTRLRFRAAIDLGTMKAYAKVGFRTERLSPINVAEGIFVTKRLPLTNNGKVKLEVKANLGLPEPEIEYSTEGNRSLVGMGDVEVTCEELNLLLDY